MSYIFHTMTFCIEKQLFLKCTFVIGENDLYFGMCSLVPFALRNLVSARSPWKYFHLGCTIPEKTKIRSVILNVTTFAREKEVFLQK